MNIIKYILSLALGTTLVYSNASAQHVVSTDPVGFVSLDVAANGYTFIGIPLVNEMSFAGVVVSVSTSEVTFSTNSFTVGEFDQVVIDSESVPQYIFEVTSGSDVGVAIPIISNNSDTLALSEDVSAYVSAGTTVNVRALHTLDSLFPNGEPFNGGSSAASADEILIFDAATQTTKSYFYYSFLGTEGWRSGSISNGLRSILPSQAIYIYRKDSAISLTFEGSVKLGTTAIDIFPGYNLIPNPYPVAYTFDLSDLYIGDPSTGLASGSSPASADEVIIYNSNAAPTTYFYYSFLGTNEWRTGSVPAGNIEIPTGGAIMINRKSPEGAFSWVKAQPF